MAPYHSSIICEAIRACRLIEFDYHGHSRVVAPYCHGFSARGVELLRAVQLGGSSAKGGFGFGKLWTLAEIRNLRATDAPFVADDPNYNPDDTAMQRIHCRVDPSRERREDLR
jgi:hypothetical protein